MTIQRLSLPNTHLSREPLRGRRTGQRGQAPGYPKAHGAALYIMLTPPPSQSDRHCHRRSGWTETP
jgi:hypothetical protein